MLLSKYKPFHHLVETRGQAYNKWQRARALNRWIKTVAKCSQAKCQHFPALKRYWACESMSTATMATPDHNWMVERNDENGGVLHDNQMTKLCKPQKCFTFSVWILVIDFSFSDIDIDTMWLMCTANLCIFSKCHENALLENFDVYIPGARVPSWNKYVHTAETKSRRPFNPI